MSNFFGNFKGKVASVKPEVQEEKQEVSLAVRNGVTEITVKSQEANKTIAALSSEEQGIVEKYRLRYDAIEKHYGFLDFKGRQVFFITSRGVDHLCRGYAKRVSVVGDPGKGIVYKNGIPYCVIIVMEVEDRNGNTRQGIGSVYVGEKGITVAIQAAETNAVMRAMRGLIGINVPDEQTALEIEGEESK